MATLTNDEVVGLLPEFKQRLDIPEDDLSQDTKLMVDIADAYEFCVEWCNDEFRDAQGNVVLPGPIKKGMVLMMQIDQANLGREGVAAESIGGLSQTFVGNTYNRARYADVYGLWRKYKKMKFLAVTSPFASYKRP